MPSLAPVFVCGATASGKTDHALNLAQKLDGEIVNADAFQLFHGIETLSAAPSPEEKSRVPHHLYGVINPGESNDAGRFAEMAGVVIAEIQSRHKTPIVVGGSGLYLKFLTHGPSPLPKADPTLRAAMETQTLGELLHQLEKIDPQEAAQVSRENRRYVARSLEICQLTGKKASSLRDGWEKKSLQVEKKLIGHWLVHERPELHRRIAQRTQAMMKYGAIEEVEQLEGIGGTWQKAIGVREIRQLLSGEITRERCQELIIFATRQYAKRQESWFRREKWLQVVKPH